MVLLPVRREKDPIQKNTKNKKQCPNTIAAWHPFEKLVTTCKPNSTPLPKLPNMAGKNRPQTVGLTLALPVTEASSQYADASESNARS